MEFLILHLGWNAIRNTHFQNFRACGALEVNFTLSTSNARGAFRDLAPQMIFRVSLKSFFGIPNRVFGSGFYNWNFTFFRVCGDPKKRVFGCAENRFWGSEIEFLGSGNFFGTRPKPLKKLCLERCG